MPRIAKMRALQESFDRPIQEAAELWTAGSIGRARPAAHRAMSDQNIRARRAHPAQFLLRAIAVRVDAPGTRRLAVTAPPSV